ncbi:MAG: NgoBV family restriction endonuclease [Pseudomonadota bacterium]|nr:NgoBV family restriction endonuclease [Pseudomonadota bacterium]
MYHPESQKMHDKLASDLPLRGGTKFTIDNAEINIEGKDGLGGLIEEWFGVWAQNQGFNIINPKKLGSSQEFPDYYVGQDEGLLEVKAFDGDAGPNFDLANFEAYCKSLSENPERIKSDYLIFSYRLNGSDLTIDRIWLKKIWQITCASERWPLKTQTKKDVIYNIRPATWFSDRAQFKTFSSQQEFINALYKTQNEYRGYDYKAQYLANC